MEELNLNDLPNEILHIVIRSCFMSTNDLQYIRLGSHVRQLFRLRGVNREFYTRSALLIRQYYPSYSKMHLEVLKLFTHIVRINLYRESNHAVVNDDALLLLTNLRSLCLCRNEIITDDGLMHMTGLTNLDLTMNKLITDSSLSHLVNLVILDIECNHRITVNGLKQLTNLTALNISTSDVDANELVAPFFLPCLALLCVGEVANMNSKTLRKIAKKRPPLKYKRTSYRERHACWGNWPYGFQPIVFFDRLMGYTELPVKGLLS